MLAHIRQQHIVQYCSHALSVFPISWCSPLYLWSVLYPLHWWSVFVPNLHWWLMSVPPHIGGQWLCLLTLVVIVYALLHWWSVCTLCSCLLLSGGQCGPVCCSVMPPFHLWSVGAFLFTWSVGSVGRRGRKRTGRKRWWRRNKRALECKHKFCLCVWFAISGLKAHSHSDGLSAFCCHPLFNDNRSQALCTGTCDSWHRT